MRQLFIRLVPLILGFSSLQVQAAGAEDYTTLESMKAAGLFNLTCSDVKDPIQSHIFVALADNKVGEIKLVTVAPGRSLDVIEFRRSEALSATVSWGRELTVTGKRPGAYFDEQMELTVTNSKNGLKGHLNYDDGDGAALDRDMICGATSYILKPNR